MKSPNAEKVCAACGAPFVSHFNGVPYCNKHYLRMYVNGTLELKQRQRNQFTIQNGIAICKTTKGQTYLIDAEDVDLCLKYKWCVDPRGYLAATVGHIHSVLHRFVLGLKDKDGTVVDHINGDKTDNRKSNLRICTQKQNLRNMKRKKNNTSGFPGVSKRANGKFRARIMVDRKEIHLGTYDTFQDAKRARIEGELKYFQNFSPTASRYYG